jgi:hypothetical protein
MLAPPEPTSQARSQADNREGSSERSLGKNRIFFTHSLTPMIPNPKHYIHIIYFQEEEFQTQTLYIKSLFSKKYKV